MWHIAITREEKILKYGEGGGVYGYTKKVNGVDTLQEIQQSK